MSAEFLQAFSFESDIQGIFGVGAPVGEAPTLDIEFRPSLTALRAHAVTKQDIGPALKRADASVQLWIPLSSAENKRKRKRQTNADLSGHPKSKPAPAKTSRHRRSDGRK